MRVVAVTVLIAWLATACGPQHAPATMHRSEQGLVVSLFGVLASSLAMSVAPDQKDWLITADVGFGAAAVTCLAVYLAADASDGRPMTEREMKQDEAWQLTKRARDQARKGRCDAVQKIQPRVQDLDPSFYDVVFVRDVAIHRCLAR